MVKKRKEGTIARKLGKRVNWSSEDDGILKMHAPNWARVAELLPERSYASLTNRWKRLQDKANPERQKRVRGLGKNYDARVKRHREKIEKQNIAKASVNRSGGFQLVTNLVERALSKVIQGAKAREYSREYNTTHKEERNTRKKQRKKDNPSFRLKENIRSRVSDYLRTNGGVKSKKTEKLLQCSWEHFDLHLTATLQRGEKKNKMDVDHIFPLKMYDVTIVNDRERAFHWRNHQLLPHTDNIVKKDRLPTKAMAAKVPKELWPDGITEDMLPDIYDGWATPLRMNAA